MAAQAQEAAPREDATTLDRIEVTGSNIPRTSTETASPVQVISRQEIDRTGKATVAEYLQTLTSDGAGSVPKTFGNGFAGGGAGVSLRGLGAGSTLVLLNGRRIAPYGLADDGQKVFTDLSTIPMEAVERVEVLKDGASAIYGSDAIAGVVNIILRQRFHRRRRQGFVRHLGRQRRQRAQGLDHRRLSATSPKTATTCSSASSVSKTDGIADQRPPQPQVDRQRRPAPVRIRHQRQPVPRLARITGGGTGAGQFAGRHRSAIRHTVARGQ